MTIETKIAKNNSNVDTANNLPIGNITVKSGTEAWAIVGKHFPKGNLEFYRAGKGFNNEDTFCYTLDEIIYVHVTCTPDNKRVKCIEIVNTYEESESERNILTVYINPDAEINTATNANEEIINATEVETATTEADNNNDAEVNTATDNGGSIETETATDNNNAPEVARFQKGTTYRYYDADTGKPLWYITIDKRTYTTVTVSGEKFKVFIQPHDRLLNYNKPTESFIRGNYRIDATDACEETADEITPSTLQKFIEAKKEVSYWRNSTGARIWQIAYIRYGINGGVVGQTRWLNRTMKEADRYLKDEYGMTLLEYLAAEDKWNATDKGAILKDKIERDCKPSVDEMPALFPAEDADDELIDEPEPSEQTKSDYAIANALNKNFQKVVRRNDYMDVTTQNGEKIVTGFGAAYIEPDWRAMDGYVFGNHYDDILARYDTPAQVETVIELLKAAIECGDREFEFPTVEDLTIAEKIAAEKAEHEANQPAEVKALNAELAASKLQAPTMWVKITDGKTGFHFGSFTRGVLSEVRVDYDAVNKYGVFYFDEPMRRYDTFAQVKTAIGQFKTAITNNAEEFTFPTIEEATADSLTRAMTIALEHYQDFCRVGNLTAATNELSLYNICRKAMTELWKGEAA